ncbi:type II toxin-antitoxin system HicA family toxin [Allosalinactinospora lopnorensis]|uniref:type II toxin-antitoxin system HicA family toxin n=1 Tax=Allosalinactinospora lopnorensis TaxID=1352348 RepID=UPI0006978F7A|nr:type II toxin-antitoxin system HicA family toxin [Allosalinactinospora lopnorensis]
MSSKEIIKLLEAEGFEHVSTRGDHYKMRRDGRSIIVPLGRDPLRMGTQKSILDAAGIDPKNLP